MAMFGLGPDVERLLMSKDPIARPFQKWVAHILTTIRRTGTFEIDAGASNLVERFIHDGLLNTHKGPNKCIYFAKSAEVTEDTMLIKIASCDDVEHEAFDSLFACHVASCPMADYLVTFLCKHPSIAHLKVRDSVFRMTHTQLEKMICITKRNLKRFANLASAEKVLKQQRIALEKESDAENVSDEEVNKVNKVTEVTKDVAEEIDPTILYADVRQYTQTRGFKVQCYSEDGRTLVKTYVGYTDAIRQMSLEDPSVLRIKAAVNNRTLYQGFRWALLERSLPDDTKQDIGGTETNTEINKGLIAMLDLHKTRIEKVYCDQIEAAKDRQLKTASSVSMAMSAQRMCSGHYFFMWNKCSEDLQNDYLQRNDNVLPSKMSSTQSQPVEKLHPISGNVLHTYASVADVIKDMCIARTTLQNAAKFGIIAKGYKWRFATKATKASTSAQASTSASTSASA